MKHSLLPIAALLALSACARVDPIDQNEVEEIDPVAAGNLIEDQQVERGVDPAYAWQVEGKRALFGPPESEALLALRCDGSNLEIARYASVSEGAGTLVFGTGSTLASVAVAGEESETGANRYRAVLSPSDIGDDLIAVFDTGLPIDVTMTGVDPLIVAANGEVTALVDNCIGREDSDSQSPALINETN